MPKKPLPVLRVALLPGTETMPPRSLRVGDYEWGVWKQHAAARGQSLSRFVRQAVAAATQKTVKK
jgi:hypothetical protein